MVESPIATMDKVSGHSCSFEDDHVEEEEEEGSVWYKTRNLMYESGSDVIDFTIGWLFAVSVKTYMLVERQSHLCNLAHLFRIISCLVSREVSH